MEQGVAAALGTVIVEVLWLPVDCDARIADPSAPCENLLGLTMFGSVGFTTKTGTTFLAFVVGALIYAVARKATGSS